VIAASESPKVPYCGGQSKSCCQSPQQCLRPIEDRYATRQEAQDGYSDAPILLSWVLRQQHPFSRSWEATAHTQLQVLPCPHQDRSLFGHHFFSFLFCTIFCKKHFFFYYHYYYFVPLRLFFSSLSQAFLNRLELFRIYMIILRSADGKQSHVVLGIFLTCSKKCISPL